LSLVFVHSHHSYFNNNQKSAIRRVWRSRSCELQFPFHSNYTQKMHAKNSSVLTSVFLLVLCLGVVMAQPVVAQGTGSVLPDRVFPDNDVFRQVTEPIRIGTEKFAMRLEKIRASGREPVGLVLTGGSARAYAHIGVLEALEAEGIRPDFVVANSMGALIGLLYAAGMAPQTIAQIVEAMPPEQYLDIVLPVRGGLLDSTELQALIRTLVGDTDLADLPIPILVTTEDLKSRRQVEVASGSLTRVLAASFALPAVFEPIPMGDLLLIDGGVTNLVPVAAAAEYSSKLIVSTALYNRPMDFGNPVTVINRAIDIGKTRSGMEDIFAFTPLVIRNDVEDISYMAFSNPSLIIERGRKSAKSCMESIKASICSPDGVDSAESATSTGIRSAGSVKPQVSDSGTQNPELQERRTFFAKRVPAQLSLLAAGALPSSDAHWNIQPVLKLADAFSSPMEAPEATGLEGQAYAGLSFDTAVGRGRYGLSALFGMGGLQGKAWGIRAQGLLNPVSTMRLSGALWLWGDFVPLSSYGLDPQSIQASVGVSWASAGLQPRFVPRLVANATYYLDTSVLDWQTGLGLEFEQSQMHFLPQTRAYAGLFAESASSTVHYGPEAEAKFGLALASFGALRLRGVSRFDLSRHGMDIKGDTSFRGKAPLGASDWVGIVNTEAVWFAKPLEFSAGEALLVSDIEVGPYFDCAWAGSSSMFKPDAFAAGISISACASMFGLKPAEFSVFGGIDNDGGLVLGIREGRLF
jgi:NTE family protein